MVGKDMIWSVTVGKGVRSSLYGKLAQLFARAGKAAGQVLDVVAVGEAETRKYEIKQYNDLLFAAKQ